MTLTAEARTIYSTVASYFSRDHHFWLQFGSLELEYGELEHAANYIEQASKYAPTDNIVLTTRAHLLYKQSLVVTIIEQARDLRDEAREILREQMIARASDNYPFHVYCTQEFAWINRWLVFLKDRKPALEELRLFANPNQCQATHAQSSRLKEIVSQINAAYLDLAKPSEAGADGFNPVL